jgi:hypothetical protein
MANLAGFVIGNAIGGPRAGLVASFMPSPLIGAIIAQGIADTEDDVDRLRRQIDQERQDINDLEAELAARWVRMREARAELAQAEGNQQQRETDQDADEQGDNASEETRESASKSKPQAR